MGSCPGLSSLVRPAAWASQRREDSANDCLFGEGVHGDWLKCYCWFGEMTHDCEGPHIYLHVISIRDYVGKLVIVWTLSKDTKRVNTAKK